MSLHGSIGGGELSRLTLSALVVIMARIDFSTFRICGSAVGGGGNDKCKRPAHANPCSPLGGGLRMRHRAHIPTVSPVKPRSLQGEAPRLPAAR